MPDDMLPPNRRVRTRTHGGVAGKVREDLPMQMVRRDIFNHFEAKDLSESYDGNCSATQGRSREAGVSRKRESKLWVTVTRNRI